MALRTRAMYRRRGPRRAVDTHPSKDGKSNRGSVPPPLGKEWHGMDQQRSGGGGGGGGGDV